MRGATRKQILARRAFRNYLALNGLSLHVAWYYTKHGEELRIPHTLVADHDGRCWWVDVPGTARGSKFDSMHSDFQDQDGIDDDGEKYVPPANAESFERYSVQYARIVVGYYKGDGKESGFWPASHHKGVEARLARIRLKRKHARIYAAARKGELALPVCLDAVPD